MTKTETYHCIYDSLFGPITLQSDGSSLIALDFGKKETLREAKLVVFDQTKNELDEYFSGKRKHFTIPLKIAGTPFQELVWSALLEIPYGETRSYEDKIGRAHV